MKNILLIIILVSTQAFAQQTKNSSLENHTFFITAEDSIKLATNIYFPEGASTDDGNKYSTVLLRTPYNKDTGVSQLKDLLKNNFVVIIQDTRGKFSSEGEFIPFKNERSDGIATTNWIRSQSWSNGKIAGWGGSSVGYTQWAIADQLDVITPITTSANIYDMVYPDGIYSLSLSFSWGFYFIAKTMNSINKDQFENSFSILPLSVADNTTIKQIDFLDEILKHPYEDGFWGSFNHRNAVTVPVYSVAGWYDIFLMGQIRDFQSLGASRHPDSRLVVGPYAHGSSAVDMNFGEDGKLSNLDDDLIQFVKKQLDGSEKESNTNPYSLFIINRNEWIDCEQWPPKNSTSTPYYLQANGNITKTHATGDKFIEYTYDPTDPYPSYGGSIFGAGAGAAYQNENITRKDQIVFESEALEEPLVLLGEIGATVYASTDAPSTDFHVQLQEVLPDGKILNIQEGGKTIFSDENSIPAIKKIDISVWATGYQINTGNKLRVVISSSLFPRYNRNLNSGEEIYSAKSTRVAKQKVYFSKNYPTQILLPVMWSVYL